ncbi:MAG: ABC transporter ATP-binding protein [Nannocystales bacterium]
MNEGFDEDDDRYSGSLDWNLWRRMVARAQPYRSAVRQMLVAGLFVAAIDAVIPALTGLLVDEALGGQLNDAIWWYGAAYVSAFVLIGAAIVWFIVLAGRIATGVGRDLRRDAFAQMQELSFSFFDQRPVGWLVSRLMGDVSKVAGLMPWFFLDVVWGGSVIAMSVAMMLWLDATLAAWVLCIVPAMAVVSVIFQRRLLASSREVRRTNSRITSAYAESIAGVRTTRALHHEDASLKEFQLESAAMYQHSVRRALQSALYLPLVVAIGSVGVGLALWRGGVRVGDDLSLGTLIAFMQYARLFYEPIRELAGRFSELQSAQAAAERIATLLDTQPEIQDSPEVRAAVQRAASEPGRALDGGDPQIESVHFDRVSFSYVDNEPVLQDVDFTVHAGQTVALVGPTGGGKSTIVSLLARFYEPRGGAVRLNGVDHRERSLHWLQSNLGVVLQSPHLFSGTVAENIRYGRLEATDAEVRAAAKRVGASSMIEALADGYETSVGEGGGKLSTGQRQLISLARAVLADPQIFIMDEATSSLDTETEAQVQAGVDAALEGRIAFVIAHRLSTIRRADQILVVVGGRIVERGTHDELLAAAGHYAELHAQANAAGSVDAAVRDARSESA